MKQLLTLFIERLKATEPGRYAVYLVVYLLWGFGMNEFGQWAQIARFENWWQILTCYGLYMIPVSIFLKPYPYWQQYFYALLPMGILEFGGYAFQTSYAYPDNILDQYFGIRNFALAMTLFFGLYIPLGNWAVGKIYGVVVSSRQ